MHDTTAHKHTKLEGGGSLQFLTFRVKDSEYGVDIMRVREIRGWTEATRLPHSAEYIRGVINLRGVVIPIFDLRCRFGQGVTEATEKHVVIIISLSVKNKERTIGLLVDSVSDIVTVGVDEVKDAPAMEDSDVDEAYIAGLLSVEDKMILLLQADHLMDAHMLQQAETSTKQIA